MMTRRRLMVTGAAGLTLALALGGVSLARSSSGAGEREDRAKYAELFEQRLADRLGVSPSKLAEARKAAGEDVIAQAQKDGLITEAQAEKLRAKLADGSWPGIMRGLGFGFGTFDGERKAAAKGAFRAAWKAGLEHLGMTASELKEAIRSGKTLEQIATQQGTTLAALGKAAAAAAKPHLDEMVAAGTLTRERADAILEKLESGRFFGKGGMRKRAA